MDRKLWLIFLVIFIDSLGFGLVIPTLPFLATKFGANAVTIGLLMATYPFFQFFGSPILGKLSDKYGRKPFLSLSLVGSALGYGLIVLSQSIFAFFLSRSISGLTGGSISVAQAYITDVTEGKERTHAIGLMGAAFGLGFIFGPLIGGILSEFGLVAPFAFAGALALSNAILIMLIVPEPKKHNIRKNKKPWNMKTFREIMQPRIVAHLIVLLFFVSLAASLLQGVFPLFAIQVFKWSAKVTGIFFAYIGVMLVFSQGFLLKRLLTHMSEKRLVQIGLFLLSIGFLFFYKEHFVYLGATFVAVSYGILIISLQSEISSHSDPDEQGVVLGVTQGVNAAAQAIGPALGGYLFGRLFLQAPFYFGFAIVFLCGIVSIFVYRRHSLAK